FLVEQLLPQNSGLFDDERGLVWGVLSDTDLEGDEARRRLGLAAPLVRAPRPGEQAQRIRNAQITVRSADGFVQRLPRFGAVGVFLQLTKCRADRLRIHSPTCARPFGQRGKWEGRDYAAPHRVTSPRTLRIFGRFR